MLQTFIEKLNNTKCEYEKSGYRGIRDQLLDKLELLKQEAEYVTKFSPEDKQALGFFSGAQGGEKNKPLTQIIAEEAGIKLRKG